MTARVVILGGGVGGMTAAQELTERGFEIVVLERQRIPGGKARSIPVLEHTGASGEMLPNPDELFLKHHVPGEHGFRFFPGFYKHVIDTMRRIRAFDGRMVADHLVPTTRVGITQYEHSDFFIPAAFPRTPRDAATVLHDMLMMFSPITGLTPDDLAFFGARLWQIMTSCEARRLGEYEKIGWWEYVDAGNRTAAYQKFLAAGITRSLVAAKARTASTRTIGDILVQLMLTIVNPIAGSTDSVLDGPTNAVWVDPWYDALVKHGVDYRFDTEVEEIRCASGRISEVVATCDGERKAFEGDYFVSALPLERIAPLLNDDIVDADPHLANLRRLAPNTEWMNGIQFYLRRDAHKTHGHVIHIDTEWALTSISQLQFWRTVSPADFDDDNVKGILSVDISDWTTPGSNGRPAMQCSREEVVEEVWSQLKRSITSDAVVLNDHDLDSWFLDPDIAPDPSKPGFLKNAEPLLVNLVDTWALRPNAATAIPNFLLASDYVRTYTDLATMEGANEAARRAVNALLDAERHGAPRCALWHLHEPELLAPLRLQDAQRYAAGEPWDDSLLQLAGVAFEHGAPALHEIGPLMMATEPFVKPVAGALIAADDLIDRTSAMRGVNPTIKPGSDFKASPGYVRHELVDEVPALADVVGPAGFFDRLSWYSEQLMDTVLGVVPKNEPQTHLYGPIAEFLGRGGKGLRSALCMATNSALGGRREDAVLPAAGIEMLHNAFLVHDDIEDGSASRRGAPTMHRHSGVPLAINAGDAMNALAMRLFRLGGERLGPATALRILDEVDHMLIETLEGQAIELGWIRDNDMATGVQEYLRMALKKTGWYSFIHPLRIGALTAAGNDERLDRFDRFGYLLGLAFQITDDVLNLKGEYARYGKEIDGDLLEGKRTLIIAHALDHAHGRDRAWVGEYLARPRQRRLPREVQRLRDILDSKGSIEWAQSTARAFADAAREEFDTVAFVNTDEGPDLAWLRSCIDYLVQRDA